jgi:hypothetical protein
MSGRASAVPSHWERRRPRTSGRSQANRTRWSATSGGKNALGASARGVSEPVEALGATALGPCAHKAPLDSNHLGHVGGGGPAASNRLCCPRRARLAAMVVDRCQRSTVSRSAGDRTSGRMLFCRVPYGAPLLPAGGACEARRARSLKVNQSWVPFHDQLYLGKATWATWRVSSGIVESGNTGKDIVHLLDRDHLRAQRIMDGQPILHPACDVVSQDSSHRGRVGVCQQSQHFCYEPQTNRNQLTRKSFWRCHVF